MMLCRWVDVPSCLSMLRLIGVGIIMYIYIQWCW
jgi:hypothetical protein